MMKTYEKCDNYFLCSNSYTHHAHHSWCNGPENIDTYCFTYIFAAFVVTILVKNMHIHRTFYDFMLAMMIVAHAVYAIEERNLNYEVNIEGHKFRIYLEPSGRKCFWKGNSPLCFIAGGCPVRTTTIKVDKSGDGAFCWIGFKYYCCI